MKMKSRLFGMNAKVALAILVFTSTTLTSCYESEKDDVLLPFTPSAALYTITGEITDITTGAKLDDAKVELKGADPQTTNTSAGSYTVNTEKAGDYTVTITKTGYEAKTVNLKIKALEKGQGSTYTISVGLYPDPFDGNKMSFDVDHQEYGTSTKVFESKDIPQVDWVNNSTSPKEVSLKITKDVGGKFADNALEISTISDSFKDGIKSFLAGSHGAIVGHNVNFKTNEAYYKFDLGPLRSLKSVTATTFYKKSTYIFRYGEESIKLAVLNAYVVEFSNSQQSNSHGHGQGHGHGHGDDLNAGGGIITGIN